MFEFRRYTLGVLTVLVLASFASAQNARPFGIFRENPEWSFADGVLSHGPQAAVEALETRSHPGDTLMTFEYLAPAGARAAMHLQGRYAIELPGAGDWTPVSIRFRT